MIRLKINLRKLTDFRTFTGKDGVEYVAFPVEKNAIFMTDKKAEMDLTLLDNRDGVDQYGYHGFAALDLGKDRRLAGEKGPILGNWKDLDGGNYRQGRDVPANQVRMKSHATAQDDDSDSEIPF